LDSSSAVENDSRRVSEPLRPMNLGEILDRTFEIYRSRFLVFLGIAVLPSLLAMAVLIFGRLLKQMDLVPAASGETKVALRAFGNWLASEGLEMYFSCLAWPVFAFLTSRILLKEEAKLASALSWFASYWRDCVGLAGAMWLLIFALPNCVGLIPTVRLAASSGAHQVVGGGWGYQLGLFFVFLVVWIAGALLCIQFATSVPVLAIERLPFSDALRRGLGLAGGGRMRVLIAWFVAWALKAVFDVGFGGVFVLALRTVLNTSRGFYLRQGAYAVLEFLAANGGWILAAPIYPIAITLFYYDQRIRREGFDIERMMEAAGMNLAEIPAAESDSDEV